MKMKNKGRWLKLWRQRNLNTFLYATESQEIQAEIARIREYCTDGETGNTPEELSRILKKSFIKDSLLSLGSRELKWENNPVLIENDGCYLIGTTETGKETRSKFDNPFLVLDPHNKFEALSKLRLIEILANIDKKENKWILNPQLFMDDAEGKTVYPSPYILFYILHRSGIPFQLKVNIFDKLNLDYFVFWPMFFYYVLTNDVDFVRKNAIPLIYPIRIYALREGGAKQGIIMRLYGDCNFNEIHSFLKAKRPVLDKLTKLMGNPHVSGRSTKELDIFIRSKKGEKNQDLAQEYYGDTIRSSVLRNSYADHLMRVKSTDSSYKQGRIDALNSNPQTKNQLIQATNNIKTPKSRSKKLIENITRMESFRPEVEKLVDEINNN